MPRATRAALRAQEILDDTIHEAAAIALPSTPNKDRVVLGEISSNVNAGNEVSAPVVSEVTSKPSKSKSTKKAGKKGKGPKQAMEEDGPIEVLEDDSCSSKSEAAVEASHLLSDHDHSGNFPPPSDCPTELTTYLIEDRDAKVLEDETSSPQSPAVEAAVESLSISEAASSDAKNHLDEERESLQSSAAPAGDLQSEESSSSDAESKRQQLAGQDIGREDSFLERIKSRSPAKRVSRIEDSVEALDALEDEIEKVGEAFPATADRSAPQKNTKSSPKSAATLGKSNPLRSKKPTTAPSKPAGARTASVKSNVRTAGTAPRSSLAASRQSIIRPTRPRPDAPANSPVPAAGKTFSGKKAIASKRVSSVHKAPFQPTKSTKPTTTASFELPGEAVARKLREKREERQKKGEEEQAKDKSFKARPVRTSQAPEVRMTAAAKARLSLAQKGPGEGGNNGESLNSARHSIAGNTKRVSSLTVAKRDAASSKSVVTQPPARHPVNRKPSIVAAVEARAGPTPEERSHQKVKGKEVFNRGLTALSDKEKDKKTKEEAAKKAREDAAERGRLASRAWAEKQKARKTAAVKAREASEASLISS